jgi:hypothetical protein
LVCQLPSVGDFDIHIDDPADFKGCTFMDLVCACDLSQYAHYATHRLDHTLDQVIMPKDLAWSYVTVDLPLLSDHAIIVAEFVSSHFADDPAVVCDIRQWRSLYVVTFACELLNNDLARSPPNDVNDVVRLYAAQLQDKHAPLVTRRVWTCQND